MSAPMKTPRTKAAIEVVFTVGKKRTLYLVPKEKAEGLESLLDDYRMDDFIPADQVFADLYAKNGRAGTAVRGFRVRDGLNQNALAKKLGCPQSWISGWESGGRSLGKKMAKKLAKVFGTDYRVFL
jgi:DNA-binding XRE family transcriptional regulator